MASLLYISPTQILANCIACMRAFDVVSYRCIQTGAWCCDSLKNSEKLLTEDSKDSNNSKTIIIILRN